MCICSSRYFRLPVARVGVVPRPPSTVRYGKDVSSIIYSYDKLTILGHRGGRDIAPVALPTLCCANNMSCRLIRCQGQDITLDKTKVAPGQQEC